MGLLSPQSSMSQSLLSDLFPQQVYPWYWGSTGSVICYIPGCAWAGSWIQSRADGMQAFQTVTERPHQMSAPDQIFVKSHRKAHMSVLLIWRFQGLSRALNGTAWRQRRRTQWQLTFGIVHSQPDHCLDSQMCKPMPHRQQQSPVKGPPGQLNSDTRSLTP